MRLIWTILYLSAALCYAGTDQPPGPVINDLDGIPRRPFDPGKMAASVLLFYWHDCPVCNSYAPEISRICAGYTNFAFNIVQVDPDLSAAAAKKHATDYGLRAPVLLDPRHRVVTLAKATVTPEAVVIGRNGEVLYRGRIDDLYPAIGKKRTAATQHDLREALDAITLGKPIKTKQTKAIGCLIQPGGSDKL